MSSSVVSVHVEIISLCKNLQKFKQFSFFFPRTRLLYCTWREIVALESIFLLMKEMIVDNFISN